MLLYLCLVILISAIRDTISVTHMDFKLKKDLFFQLDIA